MTLRRLIATLCAFMAFGALGVVVPAHAQPTDVDRATARKLFGQAGQAMDEQRFDEAAALYRQAYILVPAPTIQLGRAHALFGAGKLVASYAAYQIAASASLGEKASKEFRDAVAKAAAEAKGLARRLPRLTITLEPKQVAARIRVDGHELAAAALGKKRFVDPGKHVVEVTAQGYRAVKRELDIAEGESVPLTVVLTPLNKPAPQPAATSPPPPTALPRSAAEEGPSITSIVLLSGGAVVFGVGLTVGLVGVKEATDAPTADGPDASAALTKTIAGDIILGTGVAIAAAGLIVLLTGSSSDKTGAHCAPRFFCTRF